MARRAGDVHVALLRGINLGSRRIPMKDLAAIFETAGCEDVRTYVASGNVVYRAGKALARRIPDIVGATIADTFGFDVPIVTRTAAEIDAVVRGNPFRGEDTNPKIFHVAFLRDEPSKSKVALLDPARSPKDAFVVRGREIYINYAGGVAGSKLTMPYFDSRLGTVSTARNWRTVLTLQEMMRDGG
ncbi:MAG TPA: DUF1697 domain-containing protein [Gemmatimonadota bacterium]|nr:DUF1697 domain-containing protein [Gemmatimonadota bacterium]